VSNSGSGNERLSKNERRLASREKAREMVEAQKKKDRRRKFAIQGGLIVGTLAIVTVVALVIVNSNRPAGPGPLNMLSDGITIGEGFQAVETAAIPEGGTPVPTQPTADSDPVAIQLWVDYLCPVCGTFEATNSELIADLVDNGDATVEIHPVSILDRLSQGSAYSTRAANAAACVANTEPDSFFDFSAALFANQPAENTAGFTDEQLVEYAASAGASGEAIETCITDQSFRSFVEASTERAISNPDLLNADGDFGTPTVMVNGERFGGGVGDAAAFSAFVDAARS